MPIVNTKSGLVSGKSENGLYEFKGVPYAEPPTGKNRWLPPLPVKPWVGLKECHEYGNICPQNVMPYEAAESAASEAPASNQSEDCLTLNIWSPDLEGEKKPVMVWIHGGAYILGSGSEESANPRHISKNKDIVSVTINYRLACFGFLRLMDITDGKIPSTGNEALLDQIEALKWTKDNIASFGGDPDNITVMGHSAGGHSIGTLVAMPAAMGLFQKGIVDAGGSQTVQPKEESNRLALRLLNELEIKPNEIEKIQAMTAEQLKLFEQKMSDPNHPYTQDLDFALQAHAKPCIDGVHIPEEPIAAIRKGCAKDIDVVLGCSDNESFGFDVIYPGLREPDFDLEQAVHVSHKDWIRKSSFLDVTEESAKQEARHLMEAYKQAFDDKGLESTPAECLMRSEGDKWFWYPTVVLAEALSRHNEKVYNYVFAFPSPTPAGNSSYHGSSTPFIFGWHNTPAGKMAAGDSPDVDRVANFIFASLTNFIKFGDPAMNTEQGAWPQYGQERNTLVIDANNEVVKDYNSLIRLAWNKVEPGIPGNL